MQPLIASGWIIGEHDADVDVWIRLLSGETLLQVKNSTGCRWDLNPGPCANPLRHLAPVMKWRLGAARHI